MNKSTIFKMAHQLAKSVHQTGDCYHVTFSVALKIIINGAKKMTATKVTVSDSFPAYNERRYGKPWGAVITFDGTKAKYDFVGTYMSKAGDAGDVVIECMAGDIVAFGRKDNRSNNTYNEWYIVGSNGELQSVDKKAAYEYYKSKGV